MARIYVTNKNYGRVPHSMAPIYVILKN